MSKTTIELTEKVVFEFMHRDFPTVSMEHLPYNDFTVEFPLKVFLPQERIEQDILEEARTKEKKAQVRVNEELLKKVASKYANSNLYIRFRKSDTITINIKDVYFKNLFEFTLVNLGGANGIHLPHVTINNFTVNEMGFAFQIWKLLMNTLEYIKSPNNEVRYVQTKEPKPSKSKKKDRHSKKTYIYKKHYIIKDVESSLEKRDYHRIRESWTVRGHWREYKSGKKIWVDSFTKGTGKEEDTNYKITRVDDTKAEIKEDLS